MSRCRMLGFGREITTAQRRDGLLRRMQEAKADTMESLIAQWRTYLGRQEAIHALESEELEGRLRDEVDALQGLGLTDDEAFLIALRRVGETDSATRGFAREHFERLWTLPVSDPVGEEEGERRLPIWERALALLVPDLAVGDDGRSPRTEFVVVFGLAVVAGPRDKGRRSFRLPTH